MKIKKLYIFFTIVSVALLLGGVGFIYIDGKQNIEGERVLNESLTAKNLGFVNFVSEYKSYMLDDTSREVSIIARHEDFIKEVKKLKKDFSKDIFNTDAITELARTKKNLELKYIETDRKLSGKRSEVAREWREIEKLLSQEIVGRMKRGQEVLPDFKERLSRWGENIPFFQKVKESIDVSYIDKDRYNELQSLMLFSTWLEENGFNEKGKVSQVSLKKSFEKLSSLKVTEFVVEKLYGYLKRFEEKSNQVNNYEKKLSETVEAVEKLNEKAKIALEKELFPKWQLAVNEEVNESLKERNERHKFIVNGISIVGACIIMILLLLFMNIFPYLGKLEQMAKNVAKGNFSDKFRGRIPKNEIGQVIVAFNQMSDQLSDHIEQLKDNEKEKVELTDSIQRMRRINEIGEFAAKMSHELKNPIAILNFCLNDAREDLISSDLDSCKKEIDKSLDALERLKVLSSRLGAKTSYTQPERIETKELLTQLIDTYEGILEKNNQKISLDQPQEYHILAPRIDFMGAISNLFDNGLEYLSLNKEYKQVLMVEVKKEEDFIIFDIKNYGEEILDSEKIFNNFYTTKNSSTRGLGLTITKDIVESMNGGIEYRYKNGMSIFTIKIKE